MGESTNESLQVETGRDQQSDPCQFLEVFQRPPARLRGKPFWSWNGTLDKNEIVRQIDVMKEMGMGGAFMHSRTGLKTEYLGDEWFELINAGAEKFGENGLEGWLYDEDRWPSGTAGGIVTTDLKYRMRSLVMCHYKGGDAIDWPAQEDFFEAHLVDLAGLNLSAYTQIERHAYTHCPEGQQLLVFFREIHPSNSFYNGGAYLDTLNREATDAFINSTHEKYREHCGQHFGQSILGIFTDEPHRGFILCDNVQQPGAGASSHSLPYTEGLFELFESHFDTPLRGRLPELIFQYQGHHLSLLKWQYVELLQRLFIENWARPYADWCEANNLLLTGHVLHENTLAAQVVPVGSLFRYYETMSYPGIDVLSNCCAEFWIAKQVVSSARQFGKPYVLSELYGCTGWDMGFDGHKRIGDWQAFQGVNLRCHHLSLYSLAGESKRDYPASILDQSVWYTEYKYVEDYFSRINHVLEQGDPDCDVLVVHPGESLWAQFHLGWATWLGSDSAQIDVIEDKFSCLYHWLADAQIDFDYGDEEQMDRLGSIEVIDGEVFFRLGQMRYRSIVLGGMDTMRRSTLKRLQEFASAGGSVVFVGPCPSYVDVLPSEAAVQFAGEAVHCDWSQASLVAAVRPVCDQLLQLNRGEGVPGVISHVRRLENGDVILALVNTTEATIQGVEVSLSVVGQVERLNCRDGSVCREKPQANNGALAWTLTFDPLQEHVFRVYVNSIPAEEFSEPCRKTAAYAHSLTLDAPFDYELSEPNALVLDKARYKLGDGSWRATEEFLRVDKYVREQLGWPLRTGTMVQPWCRDGEPEVGPMLHLEYDFEVEVMPAALALVMEQPERWELCLNGEPVSLPVDGDFFIDAAFKQIELPMKHLKVGMNTLSLQTTMKADTDIEALFLIGDFGVEPRGSHFALTTLPEQLMIGDLVPQGLPFYSGKVCYSTALDAISEGQPFVCELPDFAGACIQVQCSETVEMLAFPPYRAEFTASCAQPVLRIDVYLTRQNLFGPFHRLPQKSPITSPESFRTEGDEYTEEYLFFPAGLLAAPVISFEPHSE
ncbi:hypothetical protein ACWPKS_04595 [Coraliomargarita sp. W4R72]